MNEINLTIIFHMIDFSNFVFVRSDILFGSSSTYTFCPGYGCWMEYPVLAKPVYPYKFLPKIGPFLSLLLRYKLDYIGFEAYKFGFL